MTRLSRRSVAEEQMDAPDLPAATYAEVLRDLGRVNRWTLAARPTIAFLDRVARHDARALRILDVGFGGGDMLRRIARWSDDRHISVRLVGIDLNPHSAAIAQRATTDPRVEFRTGDYADLAGDGWDVILSSLVAHHMSRGELVRFLRFMDGEARRGWLINDLLRHPVAYAGYPLLARIMRWHRIVRQDGTLSIARAYRPREWAPILKAAGVEGRVYRAFPFRLCVERCR